MINAGFAEETLVRGFYFERLGKLLGAGARARTLIVLLTSAWFGYGHYADQGLAGAQQGTIVGLVFGTIVAVTGSIILPMVAHAAFDLTSLAILYWDAEADVAHAIFK
jgi:membrane protease YdiL (CAAX protease family)